MHNWEKKQFYLLPLPKPFNDNLCNQNHKLMSFSKGILVSFKIATQKTRKKFKGHSSKSF